jgi:hypothetical protein
MATKAFVSKTWNFLCSTCCCAECDFGAGKLGELMPLQNNGEVRSRTTLAGP